jgi:hypothetical protein
MNQFVIKRSVIYRNWQKKYTNLCYLETEQELLLISSRVSECTIQCYHTELIANKFSDSLYKS